MLSVANEFACTPDPGLRMCAADRLASTVLKLRIYYLKQPPFGFAVIHGHHLEMSTRLSDDIGIYEPAEAFYIINLVNKLDFFSPRKLFILSTCTVARYSLLRTRCFGS